MEKLAEKPKYTNKLANETSPYLLQHSTNPVNWYPWGEEALDLAQNESKLIFLSIGYSTCHWCHVMESESFENPDIAKIMNENFISIKVDREERPDIDHKYMDIAVLHRGSGGWPLSLWLTPSLDPVYIATYLPPNRKGGFLLGRPSFPDVCKNLATLWSSNKKTVENSGYQLKMQYELSQHKFFANEDKKGFLRTYEERYSILNDFYENRKKSYDPKWGGFETSPTKFVRPHQISSIIRLLCSGKFSMEEKSGFATSKEMVENTLDHVLKGGIHDQIWGGFHRYSVDEKWLVPHFEKMLYDQAGMVHLLIDAATILSSNNKKTYLSAAKKCVRMVYRDMMTPEKDFFYAAQDADDSISKKEGVWYLWTKKEILSALGPEDGERACKLWDVTEKGNFEGKNIVSLISLETVLEDDDVLFLEGCVENLKKVRESDESMHRPNVDTKILRDWNGYMIGAVARLSTYCTKREEKEFFLNLASKVAKNILLLGHSSEKLIHCQGIDAYSTDYGFLLDGLVYLYEASMDETWKQVMERLGNTVISDFFVEDKKLFSFQNKKGRDMVFEVFDGAKPSTNSILAKSLIRAGTIIKSQKFVTTGKEVVDAMVSKISEIPNSFSVMLDAYAEWSFDGDLVHVEVSEDFVEELCSIFCTTKRIGVCMSVFSHGDQCKKLVQVCKDMKCMRHENVQKKDIESLLSSLIN